MKKWTMQDVMKLRYADRNNRPRPFPGRFPTRVAWEVHNRDGRKWRYLGKPSVNAARQFLSKAKLEGTILATFKEFDRSYLVLQMNRYEPVTRLRNTGACWLGTYYRPFWVHEHVSGEDRFYSNKISGHWVYSSNPTVPVAQIDTHTAWLRGRF